MYDLLVETLILVTVFSGVPMVILALVSGLVAFLQTVTQIQEQSVVQLARFIALVGVLFFWGNAALGEIEELFVRVVETSAQVMRVEKRVASSVSPKSATVLNSGSEKGEKKEPLSKTLKREK
jgi:flagellar biosynthesis protein FliQ